ncbi:MAG: hypothetical protein H6807_16435 [Planctomycetes bacterium]|nr:hypothetical protein [Planctomycetota bacterium]
MATDDRVIGPETDVSHHPEESNREGSKDVDPANGPETDVSRDLEELIREGLRDDALLKALDGALDAEIKRIMNPEGDVDEGVILRKLRYELLKRIVGLDRGAEDLIYKVLWKKGEDLHAKLFVGVEKLLADMDGKGETDDNVRRFSPDRIRRWFFDYFIRRYDIVRARKVLLLEDGCPKEGGRGRPNSARLGAWIPAFAFVVACAAVSASRGGLLPTAWAVLGAYSLIVVGSFWFGTGHRWPDWAIAMHALVPRLAGTSLVGALFFSSAGDLHARVTSLSDGQALIFEAVLALAALGYLLLEMERRLVPAPSFKALLDRGLDILLLAATHALLITSLMFGSDGSGLYALVAAVFGVGLVMNIILAEDSVTTPL